MYDRNLSLPPWLISFKTVVIFMIPCSRYREEVLAREKKLLFFIPLQDESVRLSGIYAKYCDVVGEFVQLLFSVRSIHQHS